MFNERGMDTFQMFLNCRVINIIYFFAKFVCLQRTKTLPFKTQIYAASVIYQFYYYQKKNWDQSK